MTHEEKLVALIQFLLAEDSEYAGGVIPEDLNAQKNLLRALMNVRPAGALPEKILKMQDAYLQEENAERGIIEAEKLPADAWNNVLWQGDITRLKADGIVNAANSGLTGCYRPLHNCIDNCIHTYAGMELRAYCSEIMERQGYPEPTGQVKVTSGFNLPARYILHTVGPIVDGPLRPVHEEKLRSCYCSCLEAAEQYQLRSLAFCCISTGVFGFPQKRAAEIAVETVLDYKKTHGRNLKVIFNVFKDEDRTIYEKLLKQEQF